jgi:hypothetical protein
MKRKQSNAYAYVYTYSQYRVIYDGFIEKENVRTIFRLKIYLIQFIFLRLQH